MVKIGIAAENRPMEKRVSIRPSEVSMLTSSHEVLIEKGAGLGVGFTDAEYEKAGAKIADAKEVYGSDIIVRIKEPRDYELEHTKNGAILLSMMHLRCEPKLKTSLQKHKLIAVPMENIKDPFGRRMIEAIEDSGRIGMEYGLKLWGKDPAKAVVKIMGYGNMSIGAIRAAARKRANVEVLSRNHFNEMEKHIPGTDILVDAINRPYRAEVEKEPAFVTRKMLKLFKPGSVVVDLVSNPENHAPVETMRPTWLDDLYYVVDGIYHTSCWGWPGLEPDTVTRRYSIQTAPIVKEIADMGIEKCSIAIRNAVYDFRK